jgi:hypothetical protein
MRSYDYCHFEINLGSSEPLTPTGVDAMRKEAARLADKAVAQYKIAKRNAERVLSEELSRKRLVDRIEWIRGRPDIERTVAEQAELKAFDDSEYHASQHYDYDDDWQDDQYDY